MDATDNKANRTALKTIRIGAKLLVLTFCLSFLALAVAALVDLLITSDWFDLVGIAAASAITYALHQLYKEI